LHLLLKTAEYPSNETADLLLRDLSRRITHAITRVGDIAVIPWIRGGLAHWRAQDPGSRCQADHERGACVGEQPTLASDTGYIDAMGHPGI
jgi:hypothetical protein